MNLFDTGIRPLVDDYLLAKSKEERDYGDYWGASSAGYCMRRNIFERLKVPHVESDSDARKQRVFEAGHIFHEWLQRITKNAGLSVVQEMELQDEDLMVRGHFDDLVLVGEAFGVPEPDLYEKLPLGSGVQRKQEHTQWLKDRTEHYKKTKRLILYDYKTQNSRAFSYQRGKPMSYFHKMQTGTYTYMLRKLLAEPVKPAELEGLPELNEARVLKISKDDLRMSEDSLIWSEALGQEVTAYWDKLNEYWESKTIPPCTCADREGGFLAREAYNPFFYNGEPCSLEWYKIYKENK